MRFSTIPVFIGATALFASFADFAGAHCDSLDGPVIREAFERTIAVRGIGGQAQELADLYFFETLVRLHRAGEGEAFTGLRPAGSIDPAIVAADDALETGSGAALAMRVSAAVDAGINRRFEAAANAQKHAGESIAAGRAYVEAYVEYVHFVERVALLVEHGAPRTHYDPVADSRE
jgi:hypothetical protein